MSTISDALKKAQKRRLENGPGHEMTAVPDVPVPRRGPDGRDPAPSSGVSNAPLTGIIVVVLGVCLVIFILWSRMPRGGMVAPSETFQMAPPPPVAATTPVAIAVVPAPAAPVAAPVVVTQAVPVAVAPVVPAPVRPVVPPANLPVLNGIFYSEQNPVAMINGSALKEGEDIDGYTVVRILSRGVILKSREGEFELKVK